MRKCFYIKLFSCETCSEIWYKDKLTYKIKTKKKPNKIINHPEFYLKINRKQAA